jgi:hypothetical protein
MARTWPVLITSLLALFSPAAVNYAAAEQDCASVNSTCTGNCNRMIPNYGSVESAARAGCLYNCRNGEWMCKYDNNQEKKRAEEARIQEIRRARAAIDEETKQKDSLARERAAGFRPR